MKDKIKYDLWTKFLKDYEEYFKSDSEIWYQKFDELKKYIRDENKFPNIKTKLGAWINTQNDNYKNKMIFIKKRIFCIRMNFGIITISQNLSRHQNLHHPNLRQLYARRHCRLNRTRQLQLL